jgi:hypothetical protein
VPSKELMVNPIVLDLSLISIQEINILGAGVTAGKREVKSRVILDSAAADSI